ncbi:MAG: hypothetical protein LBN21_08055 [Treponema sp.]|jgi:hypothetical protein|nr:hypothetical protein [Treponema sp.]
MDNENISNTANFGKLLQLVNGDFELARQMETVWGDADTAIEWLNKRVLSNRAPRPTDDQANGTDKGQKLPAWYNAPQHRTVTEKKGK